MPGLELRIRSGSSVNRPVLADPGADRRCGASPGPAGTPPVMPSSRATATGRAPIVTAVLGPMCMTGSRWCRRRPRRGFRGAVAGGLSLARGATGLRRAGRADQGRHRLPDELLKVIEGMALRRPPPHAAEVHRAAVKIATEQGWKTPSYTVVGEVTVGLDRGLLALAPLPAGKSKKGVDGRRQQRTGADRSVIARSYRRGETPARSPAGLHHRALCEPVAPCAASRWRFLLHQAM